MDWRPSEGLVCHLLATWLWGRKCCRGKRGWASLERRRQGAAIKRSRIGAIFVRLAGALHDLQVVHLMRGLRRLKDVRIGVTCHLKVLLCRVSHWGRVSRNSPARIYLEIGLLYIRRNILRYSLHVLLARSHLWLELVLGHEAHLVGGGIVTLFAPRVGA